MRLCLILVFALSGCNTDWSWSETFDGDLVLDETAREAWVGWQVRTEVYSEIAQEPDETEVEPEVEVDEEEPETDAVRVRVIMQAEIVPRDGELTVRMLNWGGGPDDFVDEPVEHVVPVEGSTLEVVGPWASCEAEMACVFSEERSIDLRTDGSADLHVRVKVEGEVESGSTVSEDTRVYADVWWGH